MYDLNTALSLVRTHTPNLSALLDEWHKRGWGPLGADLDPTLAAYLDAHIPRWQHRARYRLARCVSCDRVVVRPVRRAHSDEIETEVGKPIVPLGAWTTPQDSPTRLVTWDNHAYMQPNATEGTLVHPYGLNWSYVTNDVGCCGHTGKPSNCRCVCGQAVATVHSDCCGVHYALIHPGGVVWQLGLDPLASKEEEILEKIRKSNATGRAWLLKAQPFSLHPSLDVAVREEMGVGDVMRSSPVRYDRPDGEISAEWERDYESVGVSMRFDRREVRAMSVLWVRKTKALRFFVALDGDGGRAELVDDRTYEGAGWDVSVGVAREALGRLQKPFVSEDLAEIVRMFPAPSRGQMWIEERSWLKELCVGG